MILGLDHIAIICSSEQSIDFYKQLGFVETCREDRGYDILVFLKGFGFMLEMFIDPTHPPRVDRPEAMGLRHLALRVDSVEDTLKELKIEAEPIRVREGKHFTFFNVKHMQPASYSSCMCNPVRHQHAFCGLRPRRAA